jgi:hypothetical protein
MYSEGSGPILSLLSILSIPSSSSMPLTDPFH